jgi:hypothetical protein
MCCYDMTNDGSVKVANRLWVLAARGEEQFVLSAFDRM